MSRASAPGKVILFGEHAVVYGKPALVGALSSRLFLTLTKAEASHLEIAKVGIDAPIPGEKPIQKFFEAGINLLKIPPISIEIESEFPIGAGLGSSGAMACAFLQAASDTFGIGLTRDQICTHAHQLEKIIHGNPSGIDTAISTFGGFLSYQAGSISNLPLPDLPLTLGYTNKSGETGRTVARVRSLYESDQAGTQKILDGIGNITEEAAGAIENSDLKKLGNLMNENHELLDQLGVSSPELNRLVTAALDAGAYGAKLTGGGGGGCIVAIGGEEVEEAIANAGGTPISIKLSERGVESETIP